MQSDRVVIVQYLREILNELGEKEARISNGVLDSWISISWPMLPAPHIASLVVTLYKNTLNFEKRWGPDQYKLQRRSFGKVKLAERVCEKRIRKWIKQTANHFRRATKNHYVRAVKAERIALGFEEIPNDPELASLLQEIRGVNP
jgi:hypothetical protein